MQELAELLQVARVIAQGVRRAVALHAQLLQVALDRRSEVHKHYSSGEFSPGSQKNTLGLHGKHGVVELPFLQCGQRLLALPGAPALFVFALR